MTPRQRLDQQRAQQLKKEQQLRREIAEAYRVAWLRVRDNLDKLLAQIDAAKAAGKPVPADWLFREQRLERFEREALARMRLFVDFSTRRISEAQIRAMMDGQTDARDLLKSTLPTGSGATVTPPLPVAQLEGIVRASLPGQPLGNLLASLGASSALQARRTLIEGVALGKGPREIAREMRGAFNGNAVRALTVARTEVLRAYRASTLATYQQNRRVLQGWVWVAALDRRTCPVCIAQNGTFHTLDESLNSHPNCRCAMAPATRDDIPGAAPIQPETGEAWFARQDEGAQRRILGPGKYRLYKAGSITLQDLVEPTVSPVWGAGLKERSLRSLRVTV